MTSAHSWFIALAVLFALAAPASAQQGISGEADGAPVNLFGMTAESLTPLSVVAHPLAHARVDAPPLPVRLRRQVARSEALMIVGGAGLLVGAVIGGDAGTVVMVGSGVVGLVGLYRYLQ